MKNQEIATAFFNNESTNTKESFFVEVVNGVTMAFSYGQHFPICVKFSDGVLFNSDGYSNTTTRHKNLIKAQLNDLTDGDFMTTGKLRNIVDKVRYNDIKTKVEIVEQKI